MTEIVVVNQSSVLLDAEIQANFGAFEKWANTLVVPAYGLEPVSLGFKSVSALISSDWLLTIGDHADISGALGYHFDNQGRVSGRIFAADCQADGVSWTVDFTHELGEMLVDPMADTIIMLSDGRQTMKEICDPVESDDCAIDIDGVLCSDFVLPSYWDVGPAPWDHNLRLDAAVPALAPGGYISIYSNGKWAQTFAEFANGILSDRATSHAYRIGRHAWKRIGRS